MNRENWEKAKAFHGHECPGLAIGAAACEAVAQKLAFTRAEDEEIVCVCENDACGVDAIQAIMGCTLGKGNLILKDTGKQVFTFFNRTTGQGLRLYLKVDKQGMERDEWKEYLLCAPADELFAIGEPHFAPPETARLFGRVTCGLCGKVAAESRARLQDGRPVCLECYKEYGRGW